MSTCYITIEPHTLATFNEATKGISHGAQDIEELKATDGKIHVMFTRYGTNRIQDLLDTVSCWSEHDCEYDSLVYPDDEFDVE